MEGGGKIARVECKEKNHVENGKTFYFGGEVGKSIIFLEGLEASPVLLSDKCSWK
jgi:hypothetical protein